MHMIEISKCYVHRDKDNIETESYNFYTASQCRNNLDFGFTSPTHWYIL